MMDKITFNFFLDSKESVISKLSAYLGIPQTSVTEALEYGCSTESFINDLHINLRAFDSSKVCIIGRHVTTATDSGLSSIVGKGLLNLKRSLQENTPLSEYLRSQKIQIDVDNGLIYINGKSIPIESRKGSDHVCFRGKKTVCSWSFGCEAFEKLTILANKLYNLGAAVEFFVAGTLDEMLGYSTVKHCPEILDTLDQLVSAIHSPYGQCTYPLCCGWATEDKNCYVVEFPNTLSNMETYNPINYLEAFREIKGCFAWSDITYDDYYEHRIPQRVYDNRFLIDTIISVYVYYSREQYGSLQPGFSVTPELLKIYRVDDGQLIAI